MLRKISFYVVVSAIVSYLLLHFGFAAAESGGAATIGDVASNVKDSMEGLSKLINSAALVAGMGFAVGAVLKFKQHKDNPTQIPVGTPIALIFIAAALLFLPSVFGSLGKTLFGTSPKAGNLSGDITIT